MVFDECLAYPAASDAGRARRCDRTLRWARRGRAIGLRSGVRLAGPDATALTRVTQPGQAQFGIVQGGISRTCATRASRRPCAIGFEAYAIGGLSVGEPIDVMYDIVGQTRR